MHDANHGSFLAKKCTQINGSSVAILAGNDYNWHSTNVLHHTTLTFKDKDEDIDAGRIIRFSNILNG
jgi:linoleoyl-CoA desaturase